MRTFELFAVREVLSNRLPSQILDDATWFLSLASRSFSLSMLFLLRIYNGWNIKGLDINLLLLHRQKTNSSRKHRKAFKLPIVRIFLLPIHYAIFCCLHCHLNLNQLCFLYVSYTLGCISSLLFLDSLLCKLLQIFYYQMLHLQKTKES